MQSNLLEYSSLCGGEIYPCLLVAVMLVCIVHTTTTTWWNPTKVGSGKVGCTQSLPNLVKDRDIVSGDPRLEKNNIKSQNNFFIKKNQNKNNRVNK